MSPKETGIKGLQWSRYAEGRTYLPGGPGDEGVRKFG